MEVEVGWNGNKLGFSRLTKLWSTTKGCLYSKTVFVTENTAVASIFVLLLVLRGHSPKSGLGAAAGKTETERVKSDESGTISASGKYIKGKLFNRKNVSCDRKCVRARVYTST